MIVYCCIDQIVILWAHCWATNCLRYAVLTNSNHLYFFSPAFQYQCCWRKHQFPMINLKTIQVFWNQAVLEWLGISWKPRRRQFQRRSQYDWSESLDCIKYWLLFSLIDHSDISESGSGGVLHLCGDLLSFDSYIKPFFISPYFLIESEKLFSHLTILIINDPTQYLRLINKDVGHRRR